MKYQVYDEDNVRVTITQEQLDEVNSKNGKDLSIEMIVAMGMAREKRFVQQLLEALYHEKQKARIEAIYALLGIVDSKNIAVLKEKEQNIPDDEFKAPISEKAILQAVLIRLNEGPTGAKKTFSNEEGLPIIKNALLYNYDSNLPLLKEDVEFILYALEAYLIKEEVWIKQLKRDEYEDVIIKSLEGIMRTAEETSILSQLKDNEYEILINAGMQILKMRIDSYAKEIVVSFAKFLPSKIAFSMLKPILNKSIRGDLRKELELSLQALKEKDERK